MGLPRPRRTHLVRELAPFVLLVCACGVAVRQTAEPLPSPPPPAVTPASSATGAPAAESLAAFEALAARGPTVAPGMREVARKEGGAEPVDLARADGRDTCIRVAFLATAPVSARLVDGTGNVLAAGGDPSTDGVLALKGPVCIRKGNVVKGVAEGNGARVRWVAWEAP